MKKFLVVAVVLAIACLSSIAFAADVTLGGTTAIRSRMIDDTDMNKNIADHQAYTQTRYIFDVNVKADGVKGKMSLWNDFDTWNKNDVSDKNQKGTSNPWIREAWIDFMVPDMPVGLKAGQMLTQLNNGWFLRSMYSGSEAWMVYVPMGKNLIAVQDTKVNEGSNTTSADDIDIYSAVGSFQLSDTMTVGIDVSMLRDNTGGVVSAPTGSTTEGRLYNIGLNFNGKVGPATLKAELDVQSGEAKSAINDNKAKYSGNQIVIMGTMPLDPITLNATLARGSGDKIGETDHKGIVTLMDKAGPKYTFLYDYQMKSASGTTQQGFRNTTAVEVGAMVKVAKSVSVGADVWYLQATEKIANGLGAQSTDVGSEIDAKANWQIYPNLSWNWIVAYFKPGAAFKTAAGTTDAVTGIQGILALTF